MADISSIDKNLKVEKPSESVKAVFYDVENEPFELNGVFREGEDLVRMPGEIAKNTNQGAAFLYKHSAGATVKFKTDTNYIAVRAEFSSMEKFSHMSLLGTSGIDVYEKLDGEWRYHGSFLPEYNSETSFEYLLHFLPGKREYLLNLPLYSGLKKLYVGLPENAKVEKAEKCKVEKPVVFYGSSITQGGCASRPGMAYQNILARKFDFNVLNLGFSGSAHGEKIVAEHIATLDMEIFVLDFDHNARSVEELQENHEVFFKTVRNTHPDIPIIIMSRPKYHLTEEEEERRRIVYKTYCDAKESGDENVWFADGPTLMALAGDEGTVDNCHPNDLGFMSMANALENIFKQILQGEKS